MSYTDADRQLLAQVAEHSITPARCPGCRSTADGVFSPQGGPAIDGNGGRGVVWQCADCGQYVVLTRGHVQRLVRRAVACRAA